jgi:hypothetical protein
VTWGPDTTFTTGQANPTAPWTFAVTGDEATNTLTTSPIAQMIAGLAPEFTIIAGDLSYASGGVLLPEPGGSQPSYSPSAWDSYFSCISPTAQSVPWLPGVGNHEMEPLTDDGYAGFVTRFPQPYDSTSGSPVVRSFTWGNVAFLQLDGNDLSAEIAPNNGYTEGAQTSWLSSELSKYRSTGSGIDFIVVSFHNCMFCSNQTHGSDSGIRNVWQSIFDQYDVDVVFNGHVHAYERAHSIKGTTLTPAPSGSTIEPASVGTTYICAGGGGQSLYTTWYGTTTQGDAGSATPPKTNAWSGGDSATGGVGPVTEGGTTTMFIQALDPTQTSGGISSVASPAVIDTITLSRTAGPPAVTPEVGSTDLLVVAGAAVMGAGAYALHRQHRGTRQIAAPLQRLN